MFKFNNTIPERRHWRRSDVFIVLLILTYFTLYSNVAIVNFEQVNTGWVLSL